MGFIQVMEITTSRYDELEALHDRYVEESEGQRTSQSVRICRDRDRPDTYVVIVEFASYEEAMKNNDLPATARIAEGTAALADGPPIFRNLDLLRTD